uniref:Uncharacterized protein n=1 Tax=Anopheles arabiensis TaxID=7173 RepID=A0A8W7MTB3_ANOAR
MYGPMFSHSLSRSRRGCVCRFGVQSGGQKHGVGTNTVAFLKHPRKRRILSARLKRNAAP